MLSKIQKSATIGVGIAATALILTLIALLLSGYRLFTVMTPSMGTTYPVGSLVIVHPEPSYRVGDVITFRIPEGVYTHRIVGTSRQGFVTKGDLNTASDGWRVPASDVIGSVQWGARNLGWVMQTVPWLFAGVIALEVLARLRKTRRWQGVIRVAGWPLIFAGLSLWLRPWSNAQLLGLSPGASKETADLNVVNTGAFPIRVGSHVITSGQHTVVQVHATGAAGRYTVTPTPVLEWWQLLFVALVCLIPLGASFIIARTPTETLNQTHPTARRWVRVSVPLVAIAGAMATVLLVVTGLGTHAGLTTAIQNTANQSGAIDTYPGCRQMETSEGAANTFGAYAVSGTTGTTEADISGNNRPGTFLQTPTTSPSVGCPRDTPTDSTVFNGNQCLVIPTVDSDPNVFSLEAWFRADPGSMGTIIGFNSSSTGPNGFNWDRNMYLDDAGRLMFGVYGFGVQTIATPNGTNYANSTWHHVVATLSQAGAFLYVDGTLQASSPTITSGQQYDGYWMIGCGQLARWPDAAGGTPTMPAYFTGLIQYAAIYTTALSATDIAKHYLGGG